MITKTLLLSASVLALTAVPLSAHEVLFSASGLGDVPTGERVTTTAGVLQLKLDNGATLSFVDAADFRINADGSVDLYAGSVTVAAVDGSQTLIRMPAGMEGRVGGSGNAAVFSAGEAGQSDGHVLSGEAVISRGRTNRTFRSGDMWASSGTTGIRRIFARESQSTPPATAAAAHTPQPAADPAPQIADVRSGGPAAAAENGLPVSLGDALAAAGAASDILGAARRVEAASANPSLDTYPTGDLALLVARAGDLSGAYGGTPFPQAQADIIRAYLGYLAGDGTGQNFLSAYAGFLTQYLALIRTGGVPSRFGAASQSDINAFLSYQSRLGALGQLTAQNRTLAEAYLAFIQGGGNPDLFAGRYTDLVTAYFAFVRGGGDPAAFSGASTQVIDAYVAFLADSGLATQLSAQDQDLLAAYRANGSFAFAATYAAALQSYFGYLAAGNRPSTATSLTPAQLRNYLELLAGSGQLQRLLGDQAGFYSAYLEYLRGGGAVDGFPQLNANVFAGYAGQLSTYFAFLEGGGLPSAYTGDPAVLRAYLEALANAGALNAFLGANAGFFGDYLAYLRAGGAIDAFAGLNANVFTGYANALNAYYAFLAGGGLPSGYTALSQTQIAAYVAALRAQGVSGTFLAGLDEFFANYATYLAGGGNPDLYTGLPTLNLPAFADALNAYAAYLAGGGLPGSYSGASLALLATYLDALNRSGQLAGLLGGNASLLVAYFTYYGTGGTPNQFSGLPVYANYVAALNAYYAFLAGGGVPNAYTLLTQQQIADYLAALNAAGGFGAYASLNAFFTAYYTYIAGGGVPNNYGGLPGAGGGGAITPPVSLAYGGGFNPSVARINFVTTLTLGNGTQLPGSETGFEATAYALNANGGLTSYTRTGGTTRTSGTTTIGNVSGNADILIGRWHSGTNTGANPFTLNADQGFHYVLARPVAGDFALPTQGKIDYDLVAATPPTIIDGSVAPGGITADMAILLGTTPKVAFDATVTMPGAGGGANQTYRYATTGGLTSTSQSTTPFTLFANSTFQFRIDGVSGTNCADSNTCYFQAQGMFGADSDTLGLTFTATNDQATDKHVIGALMFGNGTLSGGAATTTLRTNQALAYANKLIGTDSYANVQVRYDDATGAPVGFVVTADEQMALGTASVAQSGNAGTTLYWSRWNSGTPTGTYFGDVPGAIGANGSYHMISGTPATSRPASGTVNYTLVGSTAPTFQDERTTAGTMTGSAAVAFGATPRLGLSLDVAIGGQTYNVATAGGVATPSSSAITIAADNTFDSPFNSLTVTTASSFCTPTCSAFVDGFLAGANASHLGLAYAIRNNSNPQTFIDGTAAFAASAGGSGGSTPVFEAGQAVAYAGSDVGLDYRQNAEVAYDTSGRPVAYLNAANATTRENERPTIGGASIAEGGTAAGGAIAWARWTNGTTGGRYFADQDGFVLAPNGGFHLVSGDRASNLPASGTVNYALAGATSPTVKDASKTPGTFSGTMAVTFGASPTATFAFGVAIDGGNYSFGAADRPIDTSASFGTSFFANSMAVTGVGTVCPTGACSAQMRGLVLGNGASAVGVSYNFAETGNEPLRTYGAAAFAAGSGMSGSLEAPATTQALAATPAWDRWEPGPGDSTAPQVAQAPGLAQVGTMGVVYSPEQLTQLEAYVTALQRGH